MIRYRVWPPRSYPLRAALTVAVLIAATAATWFTYQSVLWAFLVGTGLTLTMTILVFPTDVTLDGYRLHMRRLGIMRTWDLRPFRRMEEGTKALRRVVLSAHGALNPMGRTQDVTIPLPSNREEIDAVFVHLRRWVGREPTGRFELDEDHAPEDTVTDAHRRNSSDIQTG